ncbi:glycosyltransferase [Actinacidiphila yeochonensis]|uniref:glycosyltransferase n=1 Tax=Actinacidiphila yeochonensis TaxID=89050 RepID=UPI00056C3E84|nr:glycosyltransferase [Actinacidiphila yeochonensis]
MGTVPRCSVIIPTYNRAELLRLTLDALCRQSVPTTEFEVLVVDDGSSDSTAEVVESYRDRLPVRYFFQEDQGWRVAKARNVGIANAAGDVCVFLDSGVVPHSGCVQAHVESHDRADGPVAVVGYVYGFDVREKSPELLLEAVDFAEPDAGIEKLRSAGQWLDIREIFYAENTDEFNDLPAPWAVYWTCNVSASTAQLRAVGGFDEAFQCWGGEDLDVGYRLHRDGARFVLNRSACAVHYPHEKSFEANEAQANTNYRYMARKYDTPITRLLPFFGPELHSFNVNAVIRERGLPACADYLAQRGAAR